MARWTSDKNAKPYRTSSSRILAPRPAAALAALSRAEAGVLGGWAATLSAWLKSFPGYVDFERQ
jgi:hypothetical protein